MPSRNDVTYFGAGPASLPTPVLEAAAQALLNYDSTGVGLAEHSHRSPLAAQILAEAKAHLRALLSVPDDYEVLFMQGGGTGEFSAVVYNFVAVWVERRRRRAEREIAAAAAAAAAAGDNTGGGGGMAGELKGEEDLHAKVLERLRKEVESELKLDYIITGSWSLKASQEAARLLGPEHVNVVVDAREHHHQGQKDDAGKFVDIPPEDSWRLTPTKDHGGPGAAFVYYCDNETVDGVEFPSFPRCLEPKASIGEKKDDDDDEDGPLVVADMSSNILSRRVDVRKYAAIFAGAQKNLGTTGLTLLILRKSLLPPHTASVAPSVLRALSLPISPIVLDYATVAKHNSLYNTLSIFDVWVAGRVMAGLVTRFGDERVGGMEKVAGEKAGLLYAALDRRADVYGVVPTRAVRSRMNICFRVLGAGSGAPDAEREKDWLRGAENRGLLGLKGHRSVGGIRISNYNSIPLEGAQKLATYIDEYAQGQTQTETETQTQTQTQT